MPLMRAPSANLASRPSQSTLRAQRQGPSQDNCIFCAALVPPSPGFLSTSVTRRRAGLDGLGWAAARFLTLFFGAQISWPGPIDVAGSRLGHWGSTRGVGSLAPSTVETRPQALEGKHAKPKGTCFQDTKPAPTSGREEAAHAKLRVKRVPIFAHSSPSGIFLWLPWPMMPFAAHWSAQKSVPIFRPARPCHR